MNKRHKHRIDILIHPKDSKRISIKNVKLGFLNKLIMIKHKLIVLTCFLLVIGIIESICALMNAELKTYFVFFLLGLICYVKLSDLF